MSPEALTSANFRLRLKLTVDHQSRLVINFYTSVENKTCCPSPDRSGYPTAGLENYGAPGFSVGVHWRASARGVIADSRMKLLKKNLRLFKGTANHEMVHFLCLHRLISDHHKRSKKKPGSFDPGFFLGFV